MRSGSAAVSTVQPFEACGGFFDFEYPETSKGSNDRLQQDLLCEIGTLEEQQAAGQHRTADPSVSQHLITCITTAQHVVISFCFRTGKRPALILRRLLKFIFSPAERSGLGSQSVKCFYEDVSLDP